MRTTTILIAIAADNTVHKCSEARFIVLISGEKNKKNDSPHVHKRKFGEIALRSSKSVESVREVVPGRYHLAERVSIDEIERE